MEISHLEKLKAKEPTQMERRHDLLARKAAAMGMVLLQNDGVLPITPGKIALYGAGARHTVKGGKGSGDVNNRETITVETGLEQGGFTITTKAWLDKCDRAFAEDDTAWRAEIDAISKRRQVARVFAYLETVHLWCEPPAILEQDIPADTDTAIYVIARRNGEGADRIAEKGDYYLFDSERDAIALLRRRFANLIVVLNTGGVIDTSFYHQQMGRSGALLVMGMAGQQSGGALCDVLSGRITPSGKLTATWAEHYEDYGIKPPAACGRERITVRYDEGVFMGYRGFEHRKCVPAYPFGYGLSYASFSYEAPNIFDLGTEILAEVTIRNTSARFSGAESVQFYGKLDTPAEGNAQTVLVGFGKTSVLQPGKMERIQIKFPKKHLAIYSEHHRGMILRDGYYRIYVGTNSASLMEAGGFAQEKTVILENLPEIWEATEEGFREKQAPEITGGQAWHIPKSVRTDADRVALVLGDDQKTEHSIVGNSEGEVPGAAGYTTSKVEGVPSLAMADGPGGLRLLTHFQVDEQGNLVNRRDMEGLEGGKFSVPVGKQTADAQEYYQFCTCFPTGTLLAQSWDTSLLEEIGTAVSEEMRNYGISLWLAPGMNLQRDPLCGRNFEYYSEDPLLTGKMAAAMVLGVQKSGKTGAVIKHFACNNWETGRLGGNSVVEPKALHELYLRGFQIAIEESDPAAVMTSYNAVNGIQTANSYGLCTIILRQVWKYSGVVMTDWGTTDFGADPVACIQAGNDLVMPGSSADAEKLRQAVQDGTLSREALDLCADRVIRLCQRYGISDRKAL